MPIISNLKAQITLDVSEYKAHYIVLLKMMLVFTR